MRRFRRTFIAGLVVLILATVAFWPRDARGVVGEPRDAAVYEVKRAALFAALGHGAASRDSFRERELNAYLARLLAGQAEARAARGLRVGIDELRCDLMANEGRLYVRGRLLAVPFLLEFRLESRQPVDYDPTPYRVAAARWGHLPLIPPFKWIATRQLKRLLGGLREERKILERADEVVFGDGTVQVRVAAVDQALRRLRTCSSNWVISSINSGDHNANRKRCGST